MEENRYIVKMNPYQLRTLLEALPEGIMLEIILEEDEEHGAE